MNQKTKKILKWIGLTVLTFLFFSLLNGVWYAFILMLMIGLHEYGHLLAAKRVGVKTAGFHFLPIGGIAFIKENPPEQWKKYIIAYGGPLVGLILCVLATSVWVIARFNIFNLELATCYHIENLAVPVIYIWSIINLFNLLPIYPFDGGRLLAAIHVNYENSFEKPLFFISWTFLGLALLCTLSPILLLIGFIFYRMIGRLEIDYYIRNPFERKDVFWGWVLYLGLVGAFIACLFVPYI